MRNNKGITIAALIIAIIGLSVGFAAFSNTLTIRSTATVTPSASNLRVVFSKSSSSEVAGNQNSVAPSSETYGDGATIDNSTQGNSILKDIHAKFTQPGQSVKYNTNLYVYNAGTLNAQLTGVTFNYPTGASTWKKCTVVDKVNDEEEATPSLVQSACNGISISVKVGDKKATPTDTSLSYQILNTGQSLPVEVKITYEEGSAYADGEFLVTFGDIVINATSAVDSSLVVVNPWKVAPFNITSSNIVYDETYIPTGSVPAGLPQYFELSSTSPSMVTNDGTMVMLENNDLASGLTVGTDYSLIDVDTYMNMNLGGMCQLYKFDGVGTATLYVTYNGVECTYSNLINSANHATYSVN